MRGGSGTAFKFFPPTLTAARQVELFLLPCYRVWLGSFVRSFPCSHERRNRTLAAAITRPSVACCRQQTYPRFSVSHEKCEGGGARVYSLSCIQQPLFSTAAPRVFKRDSKEEKSIAAASRRDGEKKLFRPRVSPSSSPVLQTITILTTPLHNSHICLLRAKSVSPVLFFSPGEIGGRGERRLIKQQQQQQCQRLLPPTGPTNQRGGDPSSSVFFQSRWHHHCVYSLQSPRRTVPTPPGGRQQRRGCSSGEARAASRKSAWNERENVEEEEEEERRNVMLLFRAFLARCCFCHLAWNEERGVGTVRRSSRRE